MADETEQANVAGEVAETTETQETQPTMEELQTKLDEFNKLEETRKKEIAGLNKAISEQKNNYDELLKKTETEAETKAREANEAQEAREREKNEFLTTKAEFEKEKTMFNVSKEALSLGYTIEDVEVLGFSSVEQVQKHKAWTDARLEQNKTDTTKNIEKELSSENRQTYNSNKSGVSYPTAIEKAFD